MKKVNLAFFSVFNSFRYICIKMICNLSVARLHRQDSLHFSESCRNYNLKSHSLFPMPDHAAQQQPALYRPHQQQRKYCTQMNPEQLTAH